MLSYLTSVIGGALSDSRLGKFRTIFYFSIIYCAGNIIMSSTSVPGATGRPPEAWGAILGLIFIAFGAGGIKPCVSSFGGDQLPSKDAQLIRVRRFVSPVARLN